MKYKNWYQYGLFVNHGLSRIVWFECGVVEHEYTSLMMNLAYAICLHPMRMVHLCFSYLPIMLTVLNTVLLTRTCTQDKKPKQIEYQDTVR
jgi:hypothetical protein